jgi:signal transduction histidine kinase
MEGSPVRRPQKIPIVQLNEARTLQDFQTEVIRLLGSELKIAEILFGAADVDSGILQMPAWIKSHLERQPGLLRKLEQGELVGISATEDVTTPRPVTAAGYSVVLIPMISDNRLVATLGLIAPMDGPQLSAEDIEGARQFAFEAAPILARLQHIEQLKRENERLQVRANRTETAEASLAAVVDERDMLDAMLQMRSHQQMNVAHELRTPLAAIRGYVRMILDGRTGEISDTQRNYLRIVTENTNRLINLVAWMSYVAELSSQHLKLSVFDFRDVWTESAKSSEGKLAEKSLTLMQHIADEPFVIAADRDKLALMLDEIIALAVKLANEGGAITAQLAHGRDGEISFKLQEKGASIPSDALCKIFDRPFNAIHKPSAHGEESSVINLSSVYDIVGMHGGRVFVNSTGGHGATFLFTLPAVAVGEEHSHEQAVHSGRRRR